ncbi:MAG: PHB depolymerase family esterase [Thermodesulfobacteriota bacterium]
MRLPLRASLLPLVIIFAPLITGEVRAETRHHELKVDGLSRTFHVFVPDKLDRARRIPLVIALHGGATNGEIMERFSGLSETAAKHSFIVAYPNGTGRMKAVRTWNSGRCCGYAQRRNINDVAFIEHLIKFMIEQHHVDPSRVFVTGMSNGAMMAYRVAAEIPERVAAVAAIAGTLDVEPSSLRAPVPVVHFHGTDDQFCPYEGGRGSRSLVRIGHNSVKHTIDAWVKANHADPAPMVEEMPDRFDDGTRVVKYAYKTKQDPNNIVLYKIIGGGHSWPGRKLRERLLGTATLEISANEVMWQFFEAHPKAVSRH